jgi:hypothetical protein
VAPKRDLLRPTLLDFIDKGGTVSQLPVAINKSIPFFDFYAIKGVSKLCRKYRKVK